MRVALLLVAALVAMPVSAGAAPPSVPATVVVTGRAGEVATFRLDRTARLGNGGADTPVTSAAPWAGVALTHLDKSESTYLHYAMRSALLCPGRTCEPPVFFQPTVGMTDDGKGSAVLSPGRYGVALLGPAGAKVTVTVRFRGSRTGSTTLRTTAKAHRYVAKTFDQAAPGVSRGFARVDAPGHVAVDSLAVAFVLDASAAVQYSMCATSGGRRDLDGNAGGIAPCADASGVDFLFGPNADPVLIDTGDQAVGIAFGAGAGALNEGGSGWGYDAQAAGSAARISAVYVGVAF